MPRAEEKNRLVAVDADLLGGFGRKPRHTTGLRRRRIRRVVECGQHGAAVGEAEGARRTRIWWRCVVRR